MKLILNLCSKGLLSVRIFYRGLVKIVHVQVYRFNDLFSVFPILIIK